MRTGSNDPSGGFTFRRVVTGHDSAGRSVCESDTRTRESPGWIHNLWLAPPGPADNACRGDPLLEGRPVPLAAAAGGSLFRFFLVPPRSFMRSLTDKEIERTFASLDAAAARQRGAGHCLMHATETLDYVVVLRGAVTLHLDTAEVRLGPLDSLIQRGTSHGWTNEGDDWAILAVAMIGAYPLPRVCDTRS